MGFRVTIIVLICTCIICHHVIASNTQRKVLNAPNVNGGRKPMKGPLKNAILPTNHAFQHANREDIVEQYVGNDQDLIIFGSASSQMVYKHSSECLQKSGILARGQCWHVQFAQYYSSGGCYTAANEVKVQDTGEGNMRFRAYIQYWKTKGPHPIPRFRGFNNGHAQKEFIVLTFRGTDGWRNWVTDGHFNAKYPDGSTAVMGKRVTNLWRRISTAVQRKKGPPQLLTYGIHAGFLNIWDAIKDRVHEWLTHYQVKSKKIPIVITGHSLGGAIATIAAFKLVESSQLSVSQLRVVTLEAPRPGKSSFVKEWKRLGLDSIISRITNGDDIVPKVPPTMHHPTTVPTIHLECNMGKSSALLCHKMTSVQKGLLAYFKSQSASKKPVCSSWNNWLNHVNTRHQVVMVGESKSDDIKNEHLEGELKKGSQTPKAGRVTQGLPSVKRSSSVGRSQLKPKPPTTPQTHHGFKGRHQHSRGRSAA